MAITWTTTNFIRTLKALKPVSVAIIDEAGKTYTMDTTIAVSGRNRWALVLENLQALGAWKQVMLHDDAGAVLRVIPYFDASAADEDSTIDSEEPEAAVFSRAGAAESTEEARIERIMAMQLQAQSACLEQHYKLLRIVIDGFSELAKLNNERVTGAERIRAASIDRMIDAVQMEANAGQTDSLTQIATALGPALLPLLTGGGNGNQNET